MRSLMRRFLVVASALTLGAGIAPVVFADSPTPAHGLKAEYFDNEDFTGDVAERIDPTIDFKWEAVSPADGIAAHTFSVRWTGTITPRYSEHYTFTTRSDDGIRVTIGGQQVIENWTEHAVKTDTGGIDLDADTPYDITVEFYEHNGRAEASLGWESPSQPFEIVPEDRLAPPGATTPTDTGTTPTGTGTTPTGTGTTPTGTSTTPKTPSVPAETTSTPAATESLPSVPEADFPPPSTPIAGQTFNPAPTRGEVFVRPAEGVRPLTGAHPLPIGIRLDTRRGAVRIDPAKARHVRHPKQYARLSG